ncbi:oligopeptide transporter, OPT family, partial [Cutibacterium acnes subsp. acnes]|nr:oligopeptide transporter, OPT family [Cutibacterium acnes subsp. acnes]
GAEVLKVGDSAGAAEANKVGLRVIIVGSVVSAAYALLSDLKLVKSALTKPFKTGDSSGSMVGVSMSMALIGVGHLVGIAVAAAILVGLFI